MIARESLRWNGWGRLGESTQMTRSREAALLAELGRRLGRPLARGAEPVELDAIRLPPPKLAPDVLARLRAACGEDGVRTSAFERVTHAVGRSLPDLFRLRRGEIEAVPEAVVVPAEEGAVAAVLRIAAEANLAVVPFGGGSSVVGGVEPRTAAGQAGALSLDTTRLDRLLRLDPESRTATFQAGIDGPSLEAALAQRGYTLGHFPQSFEHSTLGGWIATRSVGQQSDGYGGIDELLVCARVVTPAGVIRTLDVPRAASGPELNQLLLGSEGVLGVIVEATVRIRPSAARPDERGMLFRCFAGGVAAVREVARAELPVAMMRLSDAAETELSLLLRHDPARRFDPTATALSLAERLGYGAGRCALLYGAESSDARKVSTTMRRARNLLARNGGLPLGRSPGRSWRRERFRTPYLRDWLLDHGVAVDTMETALPWARLEAGHDAVVCALRSAAATHAGSGLAMAHLSHSYLDGACLYFTVLYPVEAGREIEQWRAIKRDTSEAILAAGGTISHHHGIGVDHQPWMAREKGVLGVEALRAVKRAFDPSGVMNPGKLL
ncbi:MAG: Alkyldihydroxyacetonephosphate synthase [Deltaproteobacteria bacterium]|nr:Alkyldihydroxyacetonephosphate synthase [Deltaproteobacteria bacterium]